MFNRIMFAAALAAIIAAGVATWFVVTTIPADCNTPAPAEENTGCVRC